MKGGREEGREAERKEGWQRKRKGGRWKGMGGREKGREAERKEG
jgi:hypothetical protein